MLSATETFIAIANATAAIYQKCPAFATYHVRTNLHFVKGDATIDRDVTVRTADQVAVVFDERTKKETLEAPFPAPPNFEALASYTARGTFSYTLGGNNRDVDFRIENVTPLTYRDIPTHADAVARSVRGYQIAFADDATPELGHLVLKPVTDATRGATHHLTDVYYTPSTLLPMRVVAEGPSNLLVDTSYQIVGGNWLLQTMKFRRTWYGIALFAKITADFTATFEDYRFSEAAPDPRLAPTPAP